MIEFFFLNGYRQVALAQLLPRPLPARIGMDNSGQTTTTDDNAAGKSTETELGAKQQQQQQEQQNANSKLENKLDETTIHQ